MLIIFILSFSSITCLDLSIDASLRSGKVYFRSDKELRDCRIFHNDLIDSSIPIEFVWKKLRGNFIIKKHGLYVMKCNRDRDIGSIDISIGLVYNRLSMSLDKEFREDVFNGTIPKSWFRVNIYVRKLKNTNNFASFFHNGPRLTNISRIKAISFIKNLFRLNYTLAQINVVPVYIQNTPTLSRNVTQLDKITKANYSSIYHRKSPLLDGTMGWMKSYNFSAHNRICGKGTNIHFYDDGYHLQHEDLQNPNIYVRSQITECDSFQRICDHGTPSLGILAAMKNDYGIEGLTRCADSINLYSYGHPIEDVLKFAKPGDIFGINVQYCIPNCSTMFPFACTYPWLADQFYKNGIILVQAAGNAHLDLNSYDICKNQKGAQYGFVVSATIRDSDTKRDKGITDLGIGWFTNYNHDNSIVNNWGDRVTTTYAMNGDIYFGGLNRGYGSFSGTSSATPLTTGVFGILQGYMRSRCPKMFLNFDNFVEIFSATGYDQQFKYKMGYMPNLYKAIEYIEKTFVSRCKLPEKLQNFPFEKFVNEYDSLRDNWKIVSQAKPVKCNQNNIPFMNISNGYLNEELLLQWSGGRPRKLIMCQCDGFWRHKAVYMPPLSKETIKLLRGTTITFRRESRYEFRIVQTFGTRVWDLKLYSQIVFKLN